MLFKPAKELIKYSLYSVGIEVRRKVDEELFDLTQADCSHPLEAVYRSNGKTCLIKVPLSRIVTFNYSAFSLRRDGGHPFIRTLNEYENNSDMTAGNSPLRHYYGLYQPKNASELMDISYPSPDIAPDMQKAAENRL
ncbi:hypothetical protein ACPF7Z_17895 [Halomonas sp. GXIMD04776]|uniref:hypothetical protein n=1 Tax=Halomonas sp. GXIMD04776 TaxID=3415605 RepID=UPI003C887187